ncbi:MAG: 9-O-acetylesterase, partial [Bacteroidales bacterium]|nr:9-O-acetylesterase [Bacteroidales bacterium]
ARKDLTLSLGPVDDFDETYFNGKIVGSGTVWNMARLYTIPGKMVKGGKSVICVRVTDDHGDGGLYGAPDQLYLEGPDGKRVAIDGEWKVEMSLSFGKRPVTSAREPNQVTVLYNAMINPLVPFAMKGVVWYQGESNAGRAYRYRDLMSTLVLDWRAAWGTDFPFYITQIAGHHAVSPAPGEFSWAELREAQDYSSRVLDKVGLACVIDLGEADDVHPVRKQEVGDRLALLALAKDYGRAVISTGPRFKSFKIGSDNIRISFTSTAGGLKVIPSGSFAAARYGESAMDLELVRKAENGELVGFQVAGADRVWHWASARIEGDEVVVWSHEVPHPVAVRYGWADNPVCNLYNSEGLPAYPFRTDDWPGITYGKQ